MALIDYAAVVRGGTIIASYGDLSGVTERDILRLLPVHSSRIDQKIASSKLFSFITTPALVFVAVSHQAVDKQRPLAFLDTPSRRWAAAFAPASASAGDHGLNQVFASNFASLFDDYAKATKTAEIARELDETQHILTESVTKALDRGAELESISSKSETLMSTSEAFRAQATNLKWKMRCEYIKSGIWRILAIIALIYLLIAWVCGGLKLKRCL
jgi:vesicle-associated membrane protein 7